MKKNIYIVSAVALCWTEVSKRTTFQLISEVPNMFVFIQHMLIVFKLDNKWHCFQAELLLLGGIASPKWFCSSFPPLRYFAPQDVRLYQVMLFSVWGIAED